MDWRGDSKSIYVKQAAAAAVVGGKNEGEKKKIRSNTNQSGEGAAGGRGGGSSGRVQHTFHKSKVESVLRNRLRGGGGK